MNEVIKPGTPVNQTCTLADTEYSITLPAGCQHFSIQCRTAFAFRIAFVAGKVAAPTAPYITIKSGSSYTTPEKLSLDASITPTLFVASSEAGVVIEFLPWIK